MPALESTKICKQCKETKQLDAFYLQILTAEENLKKGRKF